MTTNDKKNKLKIAKYISLVFVTALITFVGSLIGFKAVGDSGLGAGEMGGVKTFIGIFSSFVFLLVCFWIVSGTFISIFSLLKARKGARLWKLFGHLFALLMSCFMSVYICFYVFYLIDVVDATKGIKLNGSWFENVGNALEKCIGGNKNVNYIIGFAFAMAWATSALIFNIAYKSLENHIWERKNKKIANENVESTNIESTTELEKLEKELQEKINNLEKQKEIKENSKNELLVAPQTNNEENPTNVVEEIKKEANENPFSGENNWDKTDDSWLTELANQNLDNNSSNVDSTSSDNNDAYSIFD